MDTVTDNNKITRNFEKKDDPDHPYCTNWPRNSNISSSMVDRFDLEEQIQNVWQTKEDLEAVTERIMEDTVFMNADQISNVLTGISELHETRMWKLWRIFETMIHQKNSFLTDEVTMGDVLDKVVDDAGKEDNE
jgi:hypothetical protein